MNPTWASWELHAQQIRGGKGPWRHVTKERRDALTGYVTTGLLNPLRTGRVPVLFAVAIDRTSFPEIDPVERAYEELFLRVDSYLARLHLAGDSHRCIAISDETRLEARLQLLMSAWRTSRGRVRRLSAYAEVPLFADSKATRLVQLADFVAHWVFRAYESGDERVLNRLVPRFDSDGRVIHGLTHLYAARHICPCVACVSRRR